MTDIDSPLYEISRVAVAVGANAHSLRTWMQRGYWHLNPDRGDTKAPVVGTSHRLSLRTALHIGTAVELMRVGLDPARAFNAAFFFAWTSSPLEGSGEDRMPGELYPDPYWTLLVAYPDQKQGVVLKVDPEKTPLTDLFFHPHATFTSGAQRSGAFVWLNQVDRQVRTALLGHRAS